MDLTAAGKRENLKDELVRVAAELLTEGGRDAVTTRAVAAAAGVQAPTIYRQFGDMHGLLDAVASYGFAAYLQSKVSREHADDPVDDLRGGWDLHVAFGLANPALYALIYGDPRPGSGFTAASEGFVVLRGLVQRIAEAGRLRVGVDFAARAVYAAGRGVTLTLLEQKPEALDLALSVLTREAVLVAITLPADTGGGAAGATEGGASSRAVALKAVLPEVTTLSPGERRLLEEWLDRLSRPDLRPTGS